MTTRLKAWLLRRLPNKYRYYNCYHEETSNYFLLFCETVPKYDTLSCGCKVVSSATLEFGDYLSVCPKSLHKLTPIRMRPGGKPKRVEIAIKEVDS